MFQNTFIPMEIGVPPWPAIAPLVLGLKERGDMRLLTLTPEQIAVSLRGDHCACALIAPALLLDDPELHVLPGAGLVVRETGTSERLVCDAPLESIRRVFVTPGAEALTLYVRLLFAEQGLSIPEFNSAQDGSASDATLISGVERDHGNIAGHDVAAMWRECTDTPMVLGVWACRSNGPIRVMRHVLGETAIRGEADLDGANAVTRNYYYRMLSAESDSIRALHRLARKHAIAGATVESIGFC
jgi:predicted solute-binding protein